jgi:GTP pyrophosphokinase
MSGATTASLLGFLLATLPAEHPERLVTPTAFDVSDPDTLALAVLEASARATLADLDLDATLTSRVKSPRSLAAKALRKGISEDNVLDRLALRIRVDHIDDCYRVMDALQARFDLVDDSYDDYIAEPKANGYQSLHAAMRTPVGIAEFQVRTHEMHHHAELGGASHHAYKVAQGLAS